MYAILQAVVLAQHSSTSYDIAGTLMVYAIKSHWINIAVLTIEFVFRGGSSKASYTKLDISSSAMLPENSLVAVL